MGRIITDLTTKKKTFGNKTLSDVVKQSMKTEPDLYLKLIKAFKKMEGVALTPLELKVGAVAEIQILINRKWKKDHDINPTKLENEIHKLAGHYLRGFVRNELYPNFNKNVDVPFSEWDDAVLKNKKITGYNA